ncbi:hypothetical protein FRC10_009282 [Ceratobasidium sp. 414]|nr:hypothetical protein FRC10_009282 [Ceratobasidium sp. 414]
MDFTREFHDAFLRENSEAPPRGRSKVITKNVYSLGDRTLKKTCKATTKEAKAAPESQPEPDQQNPPGETAESENEPTLKKVVFAVGATGTADPTPMTKEKRRRAKKILKVLRGKIQPRDV